MFHLLMVDKNPLDFALQTSIRTILLRDVFEILGGTLLKQNCCGSLSLAQRLEVLLSLPLFCVVVFQALP